MAGSSCKTFYLHLLPPTDFSTFSSFGQAVKKQGMLSEHEGAGEGMDQCLEAANGLQLFSYHLASHVLTMLSLSSRLHLKNPHK